MAGLKNFTRNQINKAGRLTWELLDKEGNDVQAFSHFCDRNADLKFATQKRYAEVVSNLLDYLVEAEVFGSTPPTAKHLNAVIASYPILLRDGSDALARRLSNNIHEQPDDEWLLRVCRTLNRPPLKAKSFDNTLAAINRFLRLSEALAREASERASLLGIEAPPNYRSLISAVSGLKSIPEKERNSIRRNSILGNILRSTGGDGMTRPRGLSIGAAARQRDTGYLDFPIDSVIALIRNAGSWRDRALWLLLAATGIRLSEALNLQWSDVDIENQKINIFDPSFRNLDCDSTLKEKLRFKGREYSMTYAIKPFRKLFFQALEQYVKNEFIPSSNSSNSTFVFQYVEKTKRGIPLVGISDAALGKGFKLACKKANVPLPNAIKQQWTLHSLRHLYGVYIVNDIPINPDQGKFGLDLAEAQMLMGHANIESTRHYCRKKRKNIERILATADTYIMDIPSLEMQYLNN